MDPSAFIINTIIATSIVPVVQALGASITTFINHIGKTIYTYFETLLLGNLNRIDISCTQLVNGRYDSPNEERWKESALNSICYFMQINKLFSHTTTYGYSNANVLIQYPLQEVLYDGFRITVYVSEKSDKDTKIQTRNKTLIIKSHKSTEQIQEFINKCINAYELHIHPPNDQTHVYIQVPSLLENEFRKYIITSKFSFDDIFFPEKEKLMKIIDKFINGKLKKVNLLLHGKPGCGKTSIIKAIAAYTGRNIICVKLSCMTADIEILDALHNRYISLPQSQIANVPLDKRIYVFEEIDTECEMIKSRKKSSSAITSPVITVPKKSKDIDNKKDFDVKMIRQKMIEKLYSKGLTLGGILNALDGLLEFNSIMIMTTNHPEQLDEALTRDGRITMKLELKHVDEVSAQSIVQKYFPGDNVKIREGMITPARLDTIAMNAVSIEEVQDAIDRICYDD